jgi:aminopeptidase N
MPVMVMDSLETNTRPLIISINKTSDILSHFDPISYEKAASLINMMNLFLTPNTFRKGIFVNNFNF